MSRTSALLLATLTPATGSALVSSDLPTLLPLAAEAAVSELRVWGIDFADRDDVVGSSSATLESHWGILLYCYDLASGSTYSANNPVNSIDSSRSIPK